MLDGLNSAAGVLEIDSDFDMDKLIEGVGLDNNLLDLFLDQNQEPTGTSISDMQPNSDFMKEYINSKTISITLPIHVKGKPDIIIRTQNIDITIQMIPKGIKWGFIVGTDSDIANLTDQMADPFPTTMFYVNLFRGSMNAGKELWAFRASTHDRLAELYKIHPTR